MALQWNFGAAYKAIGEQGFGIHVSDEVAKERGVTIRASAILDTVLDTHNDPVLHQELLTAIQTNETDTLADYPPLENYAEMFANWHSEKQGDQIKSLETIRRIAADKRQTTRTDNLLGLLREEGEAYGQMHKLYRPDHPDGRVQKFNDFWKKAGTWSIAWDTFGDLGADYDNGITRVLPLLSSRLRIAGLGQTRETWRAIPQRDIATVAAVILPQLGAVPTWIRSRNKDAQSVSL